MIKLTERMKAIVDMTEKCDAAADIGADHAMVSLALYKSGKAKTVYACDINEGPVKSAERNIYEEGAEGSVIPLLCNGLSAVYDKVQTVIIAGMGGELIAEILSEYPLDGIEKFILQPMNRGDKLREALMKLSLKIDEERLVSDMGRIYAVMAVSHGEMRLSRAEALAGPYIVKNKGPLFSEYIDRIIRYEESKTKNKASCEEHEKNVEALKKIRGVIITVTAENIKNAIEAYAPLYLAEDFDNVGLLVGDKNKEVKKVLLCLDVDERTAEEAEKTGADMIVSHHPVIFNAQKSITQDTPQGRMLLRLIKNSTAVFSAHTNMDKADGGLNDLMAEKLGLSCEEGLCSKDECIRICRADMTLRQLAEKLKKEYALPFIRFTGNPEKRVSRVAVCTGGGRSSAQLAVEKECDAYISGDLHYADIRELAFSGVDFLEIGHFYSERPVTEIFNSVIKKAYPEIITIISEEMDVFLNTF